MRISSVVMMLGLAGCNTAPATENKVNEARVEDRIDCALGKGQDFQPTCAIERNTGTTLTIRHEDGGFRRLTLDEDGTIDTSDGADGLTAKTLSDGRTEVAVGMDRYRLPADL